MEIEQTDLEEIIYQTITNGDMASYYDEMECQDGY